MEKTRPNILTIAGFDPSSGAGLTADVKTFEQLQCYGLAVCTANTVQNDVTFLKCSWIDIETIKEQIAVLFERFSIDFVKIGIVENWQVLNEVIDFLLKKNKDVKIILDPVLSASTNFDFHTSDEKQLHKLLHKIYMITPNLKEITQLCSEKSVEETIGVISKVTNLFLKGGHSENEKGVDILYTKFNEKIVFKPTLTNCSEKHGSGCVLASAIASFLAKGNSLEESCKQGKLYTEHFLSSNETLLGYHSFGVDEIRSLKVKRVKNKK